MKMNKKNKNKRTLSNKKKSTKTWSNQISMQVNVARNNKKEHKSEYMSDYFRSEKYYIDNNCYECPNCGMDIPDGYSECIECGWYRDKEEQEEI
jgi:hypothetical protein